MAKLPDLTHQDHSTVVALARLGNQAAYCELVKRNQSGVRNLLSRLSGNRAVAEDLAQQVFLAAWLGLAKLQTVEAFHGWLRQLTINTWLKHFRQRNPLQHAEQLDEYPLPAAGDNVSARIDLDRALSTLANEERLCIVLTYHEGLSHGMIAELSGLPLGTVKSHIARGSLKLRKLLAAYARGPATSDGASHDD